MSTINDLNIPEIDPRNIYFTNEKTRIIVHVDTLNQVDFGWLDVVYTKETFGDYMNGAIGPYQIVRVIGAEKAVKFVALLIKPGELT